MAFVFTKELFVITMCGGFMTLRVCPDGFVELGNKQVWLLLYRLFGFYLVCNTKA